MLAELTKLRKKVCKNKILKRTNLATKFQCMKVMCPKKCKNKGFISNKIYLKTAKLIDKKSTNLKKNTNLYKPNSQHYLNNPFQ